MLKRIVAVIALMNLLPIVGVPAHAATGQRAGCLVATLLFRKPATLHMSTRSSTWSVKGNSKFVVLDGIGQPVTVDEDTETWVLDAAGAVIHPRRPLRDDAPAARWKGKKIFDDISVDSCPQGVGWLVVYK